MSSDELNKPVKDVQAQPLELTQPSGKVQVPNQESSQIWATIKSHSSVTVDMWSIIYAFMSDAWLINKSRTDFISNDLKMTKVEGNGNRNDNFAAIIFDYDDKYGKYGDENYWCVFSSPNKGIGIMHWEFNYPIMVTALEIAAEEYSNYSHFGKQIELYCSNNPYSLSLIDFDFTNSKAIVKDDYEQHYDCKFAFETQQMGGCQYIYGIDEKTNFKMFGKYWLLIMRTKHGTTYGEIMQLDFKGHIIDV
eukprot:509480_1